MNMIFRAITALLLLSTSHLASSLIITPDDCNLSVNCWTSDSNLTQADQIANLVGVSVLELLYKGEQEEVNDSLVLAESGPFAASYTTEFFNPQDDPSKAVVTFQAAPALDCVACYVSVKGGNSNPDVYVFNLAAFGWDGMDTLTLENFWVDPVRGAISHVAIWGPSVSVAEPGPLALLLLGIIGLAIRRKY